MTRTTVLLIAMLLVPALCLQAAPPTAAKIPGQLIGVNVSGGYHVGLFIVLNGTLQFSSPPAGELASAKTILWVNRFSSIAMLDGQFSVMFPLASLYIPTNPKGTVVKVQAFQEKTNVSAVAEFDLSQLNQLIGSDLTLETLREMKARRK